MKIAVTGASGFIGTEVLKKLADFPDVEIIPLGREQTDYSVASLLKLFDGVDSVIHLAAVRGTGGSISDYHINEVLTENILIAMGEAHVKHIVFASSIAVYSDTAAIPWKENSVIKPKTLYGITKASCEYLCQYYSNKYKFTYSIVRIAQLLGLGERKKAMMNVFIDLAHSHEQLRVMGKSIASRQYIYVEDLAAILSKLAAEPDEDSAIINVGMENAYSNLEIARLINQVFENETPIDYDDSFPEVIESSQMDISFLKDKLSYYPDDMKESLTKIRAELEG